MTSPSDASANQIRSIETKTSRTLEELRTLADRSGLTRHGELRAMFQTELGLGYGDANALVHAIRNSDGERAAAAQELSPDDVLDQIYSGPKAHLREIHDGLMERINTFGPFDVVPKKGYVSLRTKRQFAMVGPATKSAVEVGINIKHLENEQGWKAEPAGSMCTYTRRLTNRDEVTQHVIDAFKCAYES